MPLTGVYRRLLELTESSACHSTGTNECAKVREKGARVEGSCHVRGNYRRPSEASYCTVVCEKIGGKEGGRNECENCIEGN